MNKDQDIEKLFQSSFENFEVSPPADLKLKIDRELTFASAKSTGKYWFFGTILVLALSSFGILLINNFFTKSENARLNSSPQIPVNSSEKINNINENSILGNSKYKKQAANIVNIKEKSLEKQIEKSNYISKNSSLEIKNTILSKEKINSKSLKIKSNSLNNKKVITKSTKNKTIRKNISSLGIKQKKHRSNFTGNKTILASNNKKLTSKKSDDGSKVEKSDLSSDNQKLEKNASKESISTDEIKEGNKLILSNSYEKSKEDSLLNLSKSGLTINDSLKYGNADSLKLGNYASDKNNIASNSISSKKTIPLLLSLKSGFSLPINRVSNPETNRIAENSLFQFQLEAIYKIRSSFGVSSGFNYFQQKESFIKQTSKTENIITGNTINYIFGDSVHYILDTNNTIIDSTVYTFISDSTLTPIYENVVSSSEEQTSYLIQSYSLPILFNYSQKLSDKFYLDLMAGGILSFQSVKFMDASSPLNNDLKLNKFGFKSCIKTHLRYQFSKFGVSLSSNFSYDFGSAKIQNVSRNRLLLDLGLGLHYQF